MSKEESSPKSDSSLSQWGYLLPLRESVVLPGATVPIFVGRPASLATVSALADKRTAKDGEEGTSDKEADTADDKEEDTSSDPKQPDTLILATQKAASAEEVTLDDLYPVAVIATMNRPIRMADTTVKIEITAVKRVVIREIASHEEGHQTVRFEETELTDMDETERLGYAHTLQNQFQELTRQKGEIDAGEALSMTTLRDKNLESLIDSLATNGNLEGNDPLSILQETDLKKRAELLVEKLEASINLRRVERKLRKRVKGQMEKGQREYYLSEQIKAAQQELGNSEEHEASDLKARIESSGMSKEVRKKANDEVRKLSTMPPASAEASVVRAYLGWLLDLPWKKRSRLRKNLSQAQSILDADHYGLKDVKQRILENLAVQQRVGRLAGPILCLVGAPGVGKTSLGESIARATGRKFVRLALGGVRDEAEIRGHRRTYVGSMPGRILQRMTQAGVRNPLFLLDEVDKMGMDWRGDPASALLEVLDPEQNSTFADHFLEVEFDLSEVMFVCTANTENIPPALHDRMELIRLSGYTEEEKMHIAARHLVPRQAKRNGLRKDEVALPSETLQTMIRGYTKEAGVRALEREITKLFRKVVLQHDWPERTDGEADSATPPAQKGKDKVADAKAEPISVGAEQLQKYLGVRRYKDDQLQLQPQLGQIHGLAWTAAGGEILTVEASCVPGGKGSVVTTGSLGDVMKESVQAALTVARGRTRFLKVVNGFPERCDTHVHVPDGATPKDGPSAGLAITLVITSAITGLEIRGDVAVTGEITLRGEVLRIGGLKEKLLAAKRAGISNAIIPADNMPEVEDISEDIRDGLTLHPVRWIDDVWQLAFAKLTKEEVRQFENGKAPLEKGLVVSYPIKQSTAVAPPSVQTH